MINKMVSNLKKHYELVIIFFCFLVFLFVLRDILTNEITFYDKMFKEFLVDSVRSDNLTVIMKIITSLGSGIALITITIILFLILKDKKYARFAAINLISITVLNIVIKSLIRRPRPLNINLIVEEGFSFPSGHSMISSAFYGFLMYIIYKNVNSKYLRYLFYIGLTILILLIGISRVYLGVHYASDVLGGILVSISYLSIYIVILPRYINRRNNKRRNKSDDCKKEI